MGAQRWDAFTQFKQRQQEAQRPYPYTGAPPTNRHHGGAHDALTDHHDPYAGQSEWMVAHLAQAGRGALMLRQDELTRHLQLGGMDLALREAKKLGSEWRERTLDAIHTHYAPDWLKQDPTFTGCHPDPDYPWIEFEDDDENVPAMRAHTYLQWVSSGMGLLVAPEAPTPDSYSRHEALAKQQYAENPLYVWLFVPPNATGGKQRPPQVIGTGVRDRDRPWLAFQWACLLGYYVLEHKHLRGAGTQGDVVYVPDPKRDRSLTPVLHTFARALLRFDWGSTLPGCGPEEQQGYGCTCPNVARSINTRPVGHAQMTGVLAPQSPQRPSGGPQSHPTGHPQEHHALTPPPGSLPVNRTSQPSGPISNQGRVTARTLGEFPPPQQPSTPPTPTPSPTEQIMPPQWRERFAGLGALKAGEASRLPSTDALHDATAEDIYPQGNVSDATLRRTIEGVGGVYDDPAATRGQSTPPGGFRRE